MKNFILKAHNVWDKCKSGFRSAATSAKTAVIAAGGAFTLWTGSVYAALPQGVTQAMDDAKSDGVELASLVLLVIIAIAAFKYIRRGL